MTIRLHRGDLPDLAHYRGNAVAVEPTHLAIVTPVVTFLTPAVAELILFFTVLIFFLATQMDFRRYMVSFFTSRDAKLRFLRISNDIEEYLGSYLAMMTAINFGVGVITAVGAWIFGLPNPILFVTQVPIPGDFASIGSVFGNQLGDIDRVGRGGDLYIRYTDGTLRNLTQEAGYGTSGLQGASSIAVRDPAVHWSGTKALFSMVIGAPPRRVTAPEALMMGSRPQSW